MNAYLATAFTALGFMLGVAVACGLIAFYQRERK